jgi:hypothetical protein
MSLILLCTMTSSSGEGLGIVVGGGEDHDDYFRQRANAIALLEPLHFRRWLDHSKSLHMMFQLI